VSVLIDTGSIDRIDKDSEFDEEEDGNAGF